MIELSDFRQRDGVLVSVFGLVFVPVGLGVMLWGRRAGQVRKKRDARKELHPDQPWMWVDKWRTPKIAGEARTTMWPAIGFATTWNLISLPILFIVPGEAADGNTAALGGLQFPLVGVGLVVWAVREVIGHRRYGASMLGLGSHPVPLGGRLRATLNIPARLEARELQVQLPASIATRPVRARTGRPARTSSGKTSSGRRRRPAR